VRKEDLELSREDIQLLSSRDALAAFFAKLGYDTNDRLVQNVAAMGFTGDNLKAAITHIERLASQDARMFEVYLFELKSVTVASTQGIVRAFRNRPGDYLLVLTDDYQRLDFVLVERYTAELPRSQPPETFSLTPSVPKQVGIRPRVLTVNRRNPDDVALRVLHYSGTCFRRGGNKPTRKPLSRPQELQVRVQRGGRLLEGRDGQVLGDPQADVVGVIADVAMRAPGSLADALDLPMRGQAS
jgi:hypothetical protein